MDLKEFRLSEGWWRGIILILTAGILGLTVWCLTHGITTAFMHLYYFPIVLLAYRYRWKGFWLSAALAFAYLVLVMLLDPGLEGNLPGALYRVVVFIGIAGIIAFLSEQLVTSRDDLNHNQQFHESVIANANVWIVVLSPDRTILVWNDAAEQISGYKKADVVGKRSVWKLLHPSDGYRQNVTTEINRIISRNQYLENFTRIRHMNGHLTPLSIHATVVKRGDETPDTIIVSAHDITSQKAAEDAIRASLDEKVLLLREVHHRVKNNLQIIISLTNLQMRKTDDPGMKQIMAETRNRVRAMSLVHEKLYRSDTLSRIDFADYTRFLATQLMSFYTIDTRRVTLDIVFERIMVDINTAVPLGLIMNELISNALKHAVPEGRKGVVSIRGGIKDDLITIIVQDDGVGMPKGIDWKKSDSLGMRLIMSLIDQVDGTVEIESGAGTMVILHMKRPAAEGGLLP